MPLFKRRQTCRVSGQSLTSVLDLGNLFVSGFYPEIVDDAPQGPLELGLGEGSGLLQLCHTVQPDSLFRQYWYQSGTNATMTRQLKKIVDRVADWVCLKENDLVLDIGCNDGTLLSHYPSNKKLERIGIDPALNLSALGRRHCDHHSTDYFNRDVFMRLSRGRRARVITSIAMFYDLEDPRAFVRDILECLSDDGIWIIQLSYSPLMYIQNGFDNIVHEHLEFYSLSSLKYLLDIFDLKIIDVELNDVNAGSIRVFVAKESNPVEGAAQFTKDIGMFRRESFLGYEKIIGLHNQEAVHKFQRRIKNLRVRTCELLHSIKGQGKTIYGYGASTKGNTLLQYYGLNTEFITAIAERQRQKFGLLTAGTWIPIISEIEMRKRKPDYLFILPWHFIHEFIDREREFLTDGGKFIIPLPELRIIG